VEESPGSPPEAARQPARGRRRGGSDARRPRVWDAEGLGLDVLAALVTASADGITIVDSSRHIVYANPAACAVLGHPLDHLLGADWLSFVPEGERETVLTLFASAARSGSSPAVAIAARRPDGVEQEIELTATALHLPGRRLLVAAFRDVTERHHQARQAAVLAQAAASVAVSDSIDATVQAIAECALRGTRALATWLTLDGEDGARVGAAAVPAEFRKRIGPAAQARAGCPMFTQALMGQRVLIYADARQQVERDLRTAALARSLRSLPWQGAAFAPLIYRGAVVGVLTALYREKELPDEAETTFLATLADQATMAAANARLVSATREKMALEERQRVAGELHDSVSQSLYGIHMGASIARERLAADPARAAQPIDHVIRLAEAAHAAMRALVFELRPESLAADGLALNLERQAEAVRSRYGIAGRTVLDAEPEIAIEVKQALYRIAQEALTNTVRHARAGRVDVRLRALRRSVVMEVADDGVGFDPGATFTGHLGLPSMRERALAAGGSLEVVSAPGQGTRIQVRVPSTPPATLPRERAPRAASPRTGDS